MAKERSVGVVLFQLGGPDSLDAVEPFLYNLFLDPDIIDFPLARIARQPLARLLAAGRAKKVQKCYAAIGGKSPLVEWTRRQALALERELRPYFRARVVVAMRYWRPFTQEAVTELEKASVNELVLLPLYPQYSKTTTRSSFNEWQRCMATSPLSQIPAKTISSFHDHPTYIAALVERIETTLERFTGREAPHLLFSAHGVPLAVIQSGDPYQAQVEETVRFVLEQGQRQLPHAVCYQSKVGAGRWLQPSIQEVIRRLASQGVRKVLVVPISFVSDHIETLHEIDQEVREEALEAGIEQFEMMPGLNDSPPFIRALAELVWERTGVEVPPGARGETQLRGRSGASLDPL